LTLGIEALLRSLGVQRADHGTSVSNGRTPNPNRIAWLPMFCPHCGTNNQTGNRYCVGCGSDLSGSAASRREQVSVRMRLAHAIGATRRARLLSAATALALLVAIGAFAALKPGAENAASEDFFTRATDRSCLKEKRTIAALERNTLQQSEPDIVTFAGALVSVVAEWRSSLQESPVPPIHSGPVAVLESALLQTVIRAGALARVARGGNPARVAAQAQLVDKASSQVDRAIETVGLARCAAFGQGSVGPISH
jgi:hypothetical protein